MRQIIRGLTKVAELGFDRAVIATDHGFVLFHEQGAGNVAPRPSGTWLVEKARCMSSCARRGPVVFARSGTSPHVVSLPNSQVYSGV